MDIDSGNIVDKAKLHMHVYALLSLFRVNLI